MLRDKELSKLIYLVPFVIVTISILIVTFFNLKSIYDRYENSHKYYKKEYIKKEQERLTTIVDSIDSYIKFKKATSINILKDEVEKNFNFVYRQLYKPQHKTLKQKILFLSKINKNFRGDFYIYTYKDSKKSIDKVQTKSKSFVYSNIEFIEKFNELIKSKDEGFILFTKKDKSRNDSGKILLSYIKHFKNDKRILIYKMALDNIQKITQNEVLNRLNLMKISSNTQIFTLDNNLNIIQKPKEFKAVEETTYKQIDTYLNKSKLKIRNKSYKYHISKTSANNYKVYIFNYIDYWDWVVAVRLDLKDIQKNLNKDIKEELDTKDTLVKQTIYIALIVWLLAIVILGYMSYRLNKIIKNYRFKIENQNNALKNINASLKTKLKKNN